MTFSYFTVSDDNDKQYYGFRTTNSELEHRFTHLFSTADVKEINEIREHLCFLIKDKESIEQKKATITTKLFNFLNKKRIKIVNKREWWELYRKYYSHSITYKTFEKDEGNKIPDFKSYTSIQEKIGAYKVNKSSDYYHEKKKQLINKTSNDFLPKLQPLRINEDFRLWSKEGQKELLKERRNFANLRENILNYITESKKLISLSKAHLICNVNNCGSHIISIHCMKQFNVNNPHTYVLTGYTLVNKIPKGDQLEKNVSYF